MKKTLLFLLVLSTTISAYATTKEVNSKIKSVTVYPIGAMIEREAKTSLSAGSQVVVLDNLTTAVDPNTVQVAGLGDFEIVSVKFELFYPYSSTKPENLRMLEDSLKMFQDQMFLLNSENSALNDEKQLILANKQIGGDNSTLTVAQLDAMAKYYRNRFKNIHQAQLKNQNKRLEVQKQINRLQSHIQSMNNYKYEKVGRIYVEVTAKRSVSATFRFSYFTHLASWQPKYNIKAKTGNDQIEVDYRALVNQSTGIDWKNVVLTLSTSRPTFNNQLPEIHTWYLDFYNYSVNVRGARAAGNGGVYANSTPETDKGEATLEEVSTGNTVYSDGEYKKVGKAKFSGAKTLINALNVSYQIENKYTVLSNNSQKQVFIKNIQIPAEFNYFTVPSVEKEAFLTASISDWGGYDLIPGNATLFYNNTYVGRTFVMSNTTDDTLKISLGRDRGIKIEHEKKRDLCTTRKVGGNIRKNFAYEITVRNTNKEEVSVVIADRVPVSKRNDISVTVGDLQGAELDKDTGIVKWKKTIPAGGKVTIQFGYEVKYPKDRSINL